MLISLSGLPGVGKTAIARQLAREIGAVHVNIDTIEQAVRESGFVVADAGYRVAYLVGYAVAADNLRLGRTVISDTVNPLPLTRDRWREVANVTGVPIMEVEVVCSDATELQARLHAGTTRPLDGRTPRWKQVARFYEPWQRQCVVIDTSARDVAESVACLRSALPR